MSLDSAPFFLSFPRPTIPIPYGNQCNYEEADPPLAVGMDPTPHDLGLANPHVPSPASVIGSETGM